MGGRHVRARADSCGPLRTTADGRAQGARRRKTWPPLVSGGVSGPKGAALVWSYHPRAGLGVGRAFRATWSLFRNTALLKTQRACPWAFHRGERGSSTPIVILDDVVT
eukprot:scaffold72673_cov53-Phaeocystis_antarctica.AAC.1